MYHCLIRTFLQINLSHGTNCAGIIAGGDNNICGVGVAFGAQIASKNMKYHKK